MTEYSRIAKGSFTSTGASKIINLPFQPDYIELVNFTAASTPTNHGIPFAKWDIIMGQGLAVVDIFNTTPVLTTGHVLTNGFTTFSGGLSQQFGPVVQHTPNTDFSIAASGAGGSGPATTITVAGAGITDHGLQTGDVVVFGGLYQTSTTGMPQLNGIPFVVTRTAATTFTIFWDTSGSNYTAFNTSTSTNNVGFYKKVLFPALYFPEDNIVAAITTGTTTTIKTTMQHNYHIGQEVAFRVPNAWGTTGLNSLPNTIIPGSPIYGYVVSITDFQTFVVSNNSTGFTAFNANQTVASVPGLNYAQSVPVGDVNTGGFTITAGSPLYPSPQYSYGNPSPFVFDSNTINGPAIRGAFVNNTSQGFIIGAGNVKVGAASIDTSSFLVGNNNDVIYWRAFLHDLAMP